MHVTAACSLTPAVCNHVAGNASHHLLSSPVLPVVVHKLTLGIDQVHDDAVVHLEGRYTMDTYCTSHSPTPRGTRATCMMHGGTADRMSSVT